MLFSISSCSSDGNAPDFDGDDPAVLSDTTIVFDWQQDTVSLQTHATKWNLEQVIVDNVPFDIDTDSHTTQYSEEFGWLGIICSDKEITMAVRKNDSSQSHSFTLQLVLDGKTAEIIGEQTGRPIGAWSDVIHLSPEGVVISADGETVRATTADYWWINEIVIDGNRYASSPEENLTCAEDRFFEKTVEWLTVIRDDKDVIITAAPNKTGKLRKFEIQLGCGDFYTRLYGTQSGTR